jgi:hypothetical protein
LLVQFVQRFRFQLTVFAWHSTVLARARTLKDERNIVAELPAGDPLDDATVLLVGRGRHQPTLSVAVGERMGVIGTLSTDAAVRCLNARDVEGIIIGDGLPAVSVEALLAILAADARFRDLPVAVLRSAMRGACRISSPPAICWFCHPAPSPWFGSAPSKS